MRVWDIPVDKLCRNHLLGEHREIHALWNIITEDKQGYAHHPETRRWRGRLAALYRRHELVAQEMIRRGYNHKSPLDKSLAQGRATQEVLVDSLEEQKRILQAKGCGCRV